MVLGVILLLVIGVAVFLLTFDLNSYRQMISTKMTEALGREVSIGKLEMKLSLIPTIKIKNIQINNPENFISDKQLLTVDTAEATLAIAPLLSRRLEIQNIDLGNAIVTLIQKNGQNNWTFKSTQQEKTLVASPKTEKNWQTRIDSISARSVKVNYQNQDKQYVVNISDFSLKQLKVFSLVTTVGDKSFKVTGTLDDLLELVAQKDDYLFNLEVEGIDMTAKISGSIGDTKNFTNLFLKAEIGGNDIRKTLEQVKVGGKAIPAQAFSIIASFQGDLNNVDITQLSAALAGTKLKADFTGQVMDLKSNPKAEMAGTINLTDWALGQLWGVQPFSSEISFSVTPSEIDITRLSLMASRSDLQVSGKISLTQPKPTVNLSVGSEYFDAQEFFALSAQSHVAPVRNTKAAKIIPNKPIDLSVLNKLNGTFSLMLPHLKVSDNVMGYLGIGGTIGLKDGLLTANQMKIEVLGGRATANFKIRSASEQNFSLAVRGDSLNLDMLKPLHEIVSHATIDFNADLSANGRSVQDVLKTLNGQVVLEIPQGTIVSPWFNELAETLGANRKKSVSFSTDDQINHIICAAVNLAVQNGKISSRDNIALETSHIGFLIGGDVDLPTEQVNLTMQPFIHQLADTKIDSLLSVATRFVRVSGSFTHLKPTLATDQAVQGLMQLGQQHPENYQLCQKVLGRQTKGQVRDEAKKIKMLPKPVEPVKQQPTFQSPQDQFKQQLLDSLTKAIQ
ncbi:MAG: AsmA family protein [Alphaproteobacteria bacterium]|nr:AsmA family protein [Alphaproteobacteria bacterium]